MGLISLGLELGSRWGSCGGGAAAGVTVLFRAEGAGLFLEGGEWATVRLLKTRCCGIDVTSSGDTGRFLEARNTMRSFLIVF